MNKRIESVTVDEQGRCNAAFYKQPVDWDDENNKYDPDFYRWSKQQKVYLGSYATNLESDQKLYLGKKLCRVVEVYSHIHTAGAGASNYVYVDIEIEDS
ncbi:hypothetical protein VF04_03970 [Nostoc linckia z7]|uniref:Uncharacterized protein n=2 Tax=Nostoc linckia TaxID=92942 RepID=A0A9Q6ENE7_NOSLI|nr:hypothetical protein [Nostoc linckia]PHK42875.1 hypothetical protein VF12_00670 [Nostoc linckia z15]PHK48032.1 hypothetical protein VF13_01645 [Nostoc linckia z16]PHJ64952.1 hypothetical protein VF02_11455 [Nostoc linckia z1]PHJ70130.1 hypothetical protein VF05_11615 [Nostoc linckia z3]PHJ75031.1 hypothetical protein VF03_11775 [Nostoc linckia z2]